MIARETADRFGEAAALWRNVRGALRIIADDGFSIEATSPKVKSAIADACGQPDFAALVAGIAETHSDTAAGLGALASQLRRSDAN